MGGFVHVLVVIAIVVVGGAFLMLGRKKPLTI
jgi:hypothetical protein